MLASSRGSSGAAVPTPAAARPVAVGHQQAYPPVAAPVYPAHMPPFPPQQPPLSAAIPPVSAMFSHQPAASQAYYHPPAPATVATQAAVPAVGSAAAVPPGPKTVLPEISDTQRVGI